MKIVINGEIKDTDSDRAGQIAELAKDGEITVYNGYQIDKADKSLLCDGDEFFFIPKNKLPAEKTLQRMLAARHTPRVFEKCKAAKVAVAGLGGLGSAVALALARTGVGELLLVDFDTVDASNLNRQQYKIKHIGMKKTDALKSEIAEINPFVKIYTKDARVGLHNAGEIFRGYDIVCECFDNPASKAELVNTLLTNNPEVKIVAASGMAGYKSSNSIKTRRLGKGLYICGDETSEAKPGEGLMAPRVAVCAGHQANMALRLIIGENET